MTPYDPPDLTDLWSQVLSAAAYLADTTRPGFTIWDAVDEAVRDWIADLLDHPQPSDPPAWDDPDPLRTAIANLLTVTSPAGTPDGIPLGDLLTAAVKCWVQEVAEAVNDGHAFTPVTHTADFLSGQ